MLPTLDLSISSYLLGRESRATGVVVRDGADKKKKSHESGKMYARFDKLVAELDSSDESSDDDLQRRQPQVNGGVGALCDGVPVTPPFPSAGSNEFQRVKAHCVGLLSATDVTSRDSALKGIALEFSTLERDTAKALVKFALLPLMMLLHDADRQESGSVTTGPPMTVYKERGIELALAAMRVVVKSGGVSGDEALDVLTVASRMINIPPTESQQAATPRNGNAQALDMQLRASESVVCAAVDTITVLLLEVQQQHAADASSSSSCLSNAWQDRGMPLGHVVASLLSVAKAGDVLGAATRQQVPL